MTNQLIAEMFEKIADMLEIQGESPFKVNAYRRGSRVILELDENVETLMEQGRLGDLPGIGEALKKKIEEYITTGTMKKYEEVASQISESLLELLKIQNVGPRTVSLLRNKLGIESIEDLESALRMGTLLQLPGMGERKIEAIKKGVESYKQSKMRISIGFAYPIAQMLIADLSSRVHCEMISAAGSVRRMKETIGDIDILVGNKDQAPVIDAFVNLPQAERVLGAGDTKASLIVSGGQQVDLRVVQPASFGAALQYFTGSQAHNIRLRGIARKKGLKINEYGIYRNDIRIGGESEAEIYQHLGLPWIPPELREDRGEIEVAIDQKLPALVELSDIKGDLHMHSIYSDGKSSIAEMASAAAQSGYDYIAICDHSKAASYAHGLDEARLLKQIEEIRQLNTRLTNIKILAGSEVDILPNGSLDISDDILAQLDIVVASLHSGFKQDVTGRILAALENSYVDIISHPTGRIINKRDAYDVDLDAIFKKAAETGTALEINAYPDRLDLSDLNARKAAAMGVLLVINTDSHHADHLGNMIFGVGNARRAWLTRQQILNTKSYEQFRQWKSARKK